MPLTYTPRKFISHPTYPYFYMIESDHRVWGDEVAKQKVEELVRHTLQAFVASLADILWKRQKGAKIDDETVNLPPDVFGRPKAPAGTWGSCIRILDPLNKTTVKVIHLDNNEAAFSIAVVPFSARNGDLFLCVGTASSTFLAPRSCSSGYIRTYAFTNNGSDLELVHKVCLVSVTSLPLPYNYLYRRRLMMSPSRLWPSKAGYALASGNPFAFMISGKRNFCGKSKPRSVISD